MKNTLKYIVILVLFCSGAVTYSQSVQDTAIVDKVSKLFSNQEILKIKMNFSINEMKRKTNDSTLINSQISYLDEDGSWKMLDVKLRARGNFRRNNCYYPPIKMEIEKSINKGTLFQGNQKIKIVFPCNMQNSANDYIIKEYMAYKLYEVVSPYHFKTRLLDITFAEQSGNNSKTHELKGIFIEDDDKVAKRHGGQVLKRPINPLGQGGLTSVQNEFFQYMIGNTDYSTAVQHNQQLIYVNNEALPVPYDFDMSGLVYTNYSVVSEIGGVSLPINSVRERMYRGFKRNPALIEQVRQEYIANETRMMEIADSLAPEFDNPKEFESARKYLAEFFEILKNDDKFKKAISAKLRTK
jgi:hypothetical protein